jgi:hypothetical protein
LNVKNGVQKIWGWVITNAVPFSSKMGCKKTTGHQEFSRFESSTNEKIYLIIKNEGFY